MLLAILLLGPLLVASRRPSFGATGPNVFVGDVTVTEPRSGSVQAAFTVSLAGTSTELVKVDFRTADGSAVSPDDFAARRGSLTFQPGELTQNVSVRVRSDSIVEPNDEFYLDLTRARNATISRSRGTATIVDSDLAISVADTTVQEDPRGVGAVQAVFVVSLSQPSSRPVSVEFSTVDGSALAPADYRPAADVLEFSPGQITKSIVIDVASDGIPENFEQFFLDLFAARGARIERSRAAGGIADANPVVFLSDTAVIEGDQGDNRATFSVLLSNSTPLPVRVRYRTLDGSASAASDYEPQEGIVTFAPGDTSREITVAVHGDLIPETLDTANNSSNSEDFLVELSDPVNVVISDGIGRCVIQDDDAALQLQDTQVTRRPFGQTQAVVEVTLSNALAKVASVDYVTRDGTAVAPSDYTATQGTLTFRPGERAKTISVPVRPGRPGDADELLFVDLLQPVNAAIRDRTASVRVATQILPNAGYWLTTADGSVFVFGDAGFFGSTGGLALREPIVGMAPTPSGHGYWLVAADGGIFSFGDAAFHGSTGALTLNSPIVGMAVTATGGGYWLVAADGGVFAFGDAPFAGSSGDLLLQRPVVGMVATGTGKGYRLVASDGGVFAFGDAPFFGSTGDAPLRSPVVAMTGTPDGGGYWTVTEAGDVRAFGPSAQTWGSSTGLVAGEAVVGIASTETGKGYWLVSQPGNVYVFGDAVFGGSVGKRNIPSPVVGIASFAF